MQRDVGLQSATDGEFRRGSWHMDFIYQLGGIEKIPGDIEVHFHNADGDRGLQAGGDAGQRERWSWSADLREDSRFLQGVVGEGVTPKLTIPSPNMVHYRGGRAALDPAVYPDIERSGPTAGRLRRADRRARRARLRLPAARRHEPGLPQRSGPARAIVRSVARTSPTYTRPTCATSTTRSPAGPPG